MAFVSLRSDGAAFPLSSAARRAGVERLPHQASFPSHGRCGVLLGVAMGVIPRDVKAGCSKAGSAADGQEDWKIDLKRMRDVDNVYTILGLPLEPPASVSEVVKVRNERFRDLAKQSVILLADVFARLPPESYRTLYPSLMMMYGSLIGVGASARAGLATWDMALHVALTLDSLRRLVSFSYNSVLPSMTQLLYSMEPIVGFNDDSQEVILTMLHNIYREVMFDVEAITYVGPVSQLLSSIGCPDLDSSSDEMIEGQIDIDSLKDLDGISKDLGLANLPVAVLSEHEKAMQGKLQAIAERSIALLADVLTRLPPPYRRPSSPLYKNLMAMYPTVATVAVLAKMGRGKRGMAVTLAAQLDDFRKVLSLRLRTPLPATMNAHLVLPVLGDAPVLPTTNAHLVQMAVTGDPEMVLMALLENVCVTVEADVDAIISSTA